MSIVVNAVVPLASVLLGAGLTYLLSVRGRRHSRVEGLFNDAIAAVAVADASQHYMASIGRPDHMSDGDYRSLLSFLARAAIENHVKRNTEAREAIARVAQYESGLARFYRDSEALVREPDAVMQLLTDVRARNI